MRTDKKRLIDEILDIFHYEIEQHLDLTRDKVEDYYDDCISIVEDFVQALNEEWNYDKEQEISDLKEDYERRIDDLEEEVRAHQDTILEMQEHIDDLIDQLGE